MLEPFNSHRRVVLESLSNTQANVRLSSLRQAVILDEPLPRPTRDFPPLHIVAGCLPPLFMLFISLNAGSPLRHGTQTAVYAVYAISSLDTGSPLSYRTQNMQPPRDTPWDFQWLFMLFMLLFML